VLEDSPSPEPVTVPRHLDVDAIRVLMTSSTLAEAFGGENDPGTDHAGSTFTRVASAAEGEHERSIALTGRDIYGITVPITVEAALCLAQGEARWSTRPEPAVRA
jgi:hypothetical protein